MQKNEMHKERNVSTKASQRKPTVETIRLQAPVIKVHLTLTMYLVNPYSGAQKELCRDDGKSRYKRAPDSR